MFVVRPCVSAIACSPFETNLSKNQKTTKTGIFLFNCLLLLPTLIAYGVLCGNNNLFNAQIPLYQQEVQVGTIQLAIFPLVTLCLACAYGFYIEIMAGYVGNNMVLNILDGKFNWYRWVHLMLGNSFQLFTALILLGTRNWAIWAPLVICNLAAMMCFMFDEISEYKIGNTYLLGVLLYLPACVFILMDGIVVGGNYEYTILNTTFYLFFQLVFLNITFKMRSFEEGYIKEYRETYYDFYVLVSRTMMTWFLYAYIFPLI
jgi:hypothetical protein